jgi:two-component system, OmpR family, phosphate regulon response regulator OmpR
MIMGTDKARILIVDDEQDLRALLQRYLSDQNFVVRATSDAAQMDRLLQRESFDVLVLDVMLPGEDGLSICRRLRAQGETIPIIMLTARGNAEDRILGREQGADDYLAKPFNPRELVACIQSLLRRQQMHGHYQRHASEQVISFGEFALQVDERRLTKADEVIPLTTGEFELLRALVSHAGRPLGRERLIELVRGRGHDANDRSIDVQVLRLRRAIEPDPGKPRYIQTVWGVGYVFVFEAGQP